MATIGKDVPVTTVLVTMTCEPANQEELVRLALASEPIFAKQPGFISSTLHRGTDGRSVMQYLQWRSLDDSNACMMSPDWQADAGTAFMAFVQSGKATLESRVYEVVSTAEAARV